jgi:hypothetical protein
VTDQAGLSSTASVRVHIEERVSYSFNITYDSLLQDPDQVISSCTFVSLISFVQLEHSQ